MSMSRVVMTCSYVHRDPPHVDPWIDAELRLVADCSVLVDGEVLWQEVDVPIAELAMQLLSWVERVNQTDEAFYYNSVESADYGLIRFVRTDGQWTVEFSTGERPKEKPVRVDRADLVSAATTFVQFVDGQLKASHRITVADLRAHRREQAELALMGPAAGHPELMTLRDSWETEANNWIAWARAPGHDSYWLYHRDLFLELLPPPPQRTLDIGCGEGRLPRDLKARGYEVTGIDAAPTLFEAAREADPDGEYLEADAAELPFRDASFGLATAFMSLHDIDDMPGAVREATRVLSPGGRLCIALVHPMNSAGKFDSSAHDAPFVIRQRYFDTRRYVDTVERDGFRVTFTMNHRPMEAYFAALESAGLLVERVAEIADPTDLPGARWQRLPLFLHIRAVKR